MATALTKDIKKLVPRTDENQFISCGICVVMRDAAVSTSSSKSKAQRIRLRKTLRKDQLQEEQRERKRAG